MYDEASRSGGIRRMTATEVQNLNAATQLGKVDKLPDGIDRMKELLISHLDQGYSHIHILEGAIDRIAGPRIQEASETVPSPIPPWQEMNIFGLLGCIEQMDRRMSEQLARIREQLP